MVDALKNANTPKEIGQLPQKFAIAGNDLNAGLLGEVAITGGAELTANTTVEFARTTDTMEELSGPGGLATGEGWNVQAAGCWGLCAGAEIADNYATENQFDTEGLIFGAGAGAEISTDIYSETEWIFWSQSNGNSCVNIPTLDVDYGACPGQ